MIDDRRQADSKVRRGKGGGGGAEGTKDRSIHLVLPNLCFQAGLSRYISKLGHQDDGGRPYFEYRDFRV